MTALFVHVTYVFGPVLPWRRCDALCISGFINDVMFAHTHYTGNVRRILVWGVNAPLLPKAKKFFENLTGAF